MTKGLKSGWAAEYTSWDAVVKNNFEEIDSTPVRILVWGAGEGWARYYDKRIQIRDHLRDENAANHAFTSEELEASYPQFRNLNTQDAEMLQVEMSDAVIVLIANDKNVTGVQTEVSIFRNDPDFYHKARLIIPKLTTKDRQRNYRAFLNQGWLDYDREHCFLYTSDQFDDCTKIRAYCSEHIKRSRAHLVFRERRRQSNY